MQLSPQDEQKAVDIIKKSPGRFRDIPIQTERICLMAVRRDGNLLQYVREQTDKIRKAAVKQNGFALRFCDIQTPELCALAIEQKPSSIRYVKDQTRELCEQALGRSHGGALACIRDPDEAICEKAMGICPAIIRHVPLRFQTDRFREMALKYNPETVRYMRQTPGLCEKAILGAMENDARALSDVLAFCEYQDPEICVRAVEKEPSAIGKIRRQTREIRDAAIENAELYSIADILLALRDPDACDYMKACGRFEEERKRLLAENPGREMPESFRDRLHSAFGAMKNPDEHVCERVLSMNGLVLSAIPAPVAGLCETAVSENGDALQYVPQGLQSEEMILTAVRQKGKALRFAERQTEKIVLAAVRQDGAALEHADIQTREICLAACENRGNALRWVWRQDRETCLAAVSQDGTALFHVIDKTPEIVEAAVRQTGKALEYAPEGMISPGLAKAAVGNYPWSFHQIPKDLKTEDLCLMAVELDPRLIGYVPAAVITREMCEIAVRSPDGVARLSERCADRGLEECPGFVPEILRAAVRGDYTLIASVNARAHDAEMYRAALLDENGGVSPEKLAFLKKNGRWTNEKALAEVLESAEKPARRDAPRP